MRINRLIALLIFAAVETLQAQPLGTSTSPLVVNTVVARATQEALGLVTVTGPTGPCSGSLLDHGWVLTAAHCVEVTNAGVTQEATHSMVTVSAAWPGAVARTGQSIRRFRDLGYDVAVIELARPMRRNGVLHGSQGFGAARLGTAEDAAPGSTVRIFGNGINRFAFRAGGVDVQSSGDGQFRYGNQTVKAVEPTAVRTKRGDPLAGGDSGGPWYLMNRDGSLVGLIAITQGCDATLLEGRSQANPTDWTWLANTGDCYGPRIDQLRPQILGAMAAGEFIPPPPAAVKTVTANATLWMNPQIKAETGGSYRLDHCERWAANCDREAGNAFCKRMDPRRPLASRIRKGANVGATTVIGDGRRCKGPECVAILSLACSAPVNPNDRFRNP